MNKLRLVIIAGTAIGVGLVALSSTAISNHRFGTDPSPALASTTAPTILENQLAALDISIKDETPGTESDIRQALESVHAGFSGFLNDSPAFVEEVVFSDKSYGQVTDGQEGVVTIKPFFTDRPAILIVLQDQPVPVSGPPNVDTPNSVNSTFVAFVDAESGEVLRAVTYSSD